MEFTSRKWFIKTVIQLYLNQKKYKEKDKDKNKKPEIITLGEFSNVNLSEDEILKLKALYKEKFNPAIEVLSSYIASSGKKYKSHYAVLGKHNWVYKKIFGETVVNPIKDKSSILRQVNEVF